MAASELGINLTPVQVPELDNETPDIIIGPVARRSCGPRTARTPCRPTCLAKFGRDVGLAGMIWYAPIYPLAFTSYTLS